MTAAIVLTEMRITEIIVLGTVTSKIAILIARAKIVVSIGKKRYPLCVQGGKILSTNNPKMILSFSAKYKDYRFARRTVQRGLARFAP